MQEREDHLVDTFGRVHNYLRISLTERCNLRCQYCMPEDGVPLQPSSDLLSAAEILRLTTLFAQAGVSKLRLTGGEPLIRPDIVPLAAALHAIPGIDSLGITTNGLVLSKHLAALCALPARLNISLDTLNEAKFAKITRRNGFQRVWAAIEAAVAASPVQVKLNCVVMRDFNLDEVADFVRLTARLNVDVRFIEWMPFDQNRWNDQTFVPFAEMLAGLHAAFPGIAPLDNHPNDTSKSFALPDAPGRFSFITSMSEHFCGGCNRLRLTADGNLKVCLFGNAEVSLRDAMRHGGYSDDDLLLVIQAAVKRKKFALGGHRDMHGIAKAQNRPMILIGG
ncbi:molybdenum cofactor biosynthesis protein A, variant [Aphanomyces astaci]|uniref:GTP 3',8-cyclase n=1 Tax=Aphanomyces astaci TaxID=112090 RepID=W4GXZ1_APHAT|nr:molybdenum cofactor biosynthesis protein A, variant [Aphanomyces astaci]ETV83783.1 molybdenum cofactor biosynthesis protein A, variant [Aphanomyces astaci]|eukprot:XP_009827213.1 molybdenum cofactor biosynthesis protein A, variant [Aphanomyces astaci]